MTYNVFGGTLSLTQSVKKVKRQRGANVAQEHINIFAADCKDDRLKKQCFMWVT